MSKMDESDFVGTGNWQFCAKWGQRVLPDERAEAERQLLEKEQTVEQIVSRFNFSSVQVVYGWIGRYIEESLLSDTSQRPEVDSKELTWSEVLKEIKRLKKAPDREDKKLFNEVSRKFMVDFLTFERQQNGFRLGKVRGSEDNL